MAKINVIKKSKELIDEIDKVNTQFSSLTRNASQLEKELAKKKAAYQKRDEERAKAQAEATPAPEVKEEKPEIVEVAKPADEQKPAEASKPVEEPAKAEAPAKEVKAEAPEKEERIEAKEPEKQEKPEYKPEQNTQKQENRPERRDDRSNQRREGRPEGNRAERGDRPERSFERGDRPFENRQNRDGSRPDNRNGDRPNRREGNRDNSQNNGNNNGRFEKRNDSYGKPAMNNNRGGVARDKDEDDDSSRRRSQPHQQNKGTKDKDAMSSMMPNKQTATRDFNQKGNNKDKSKKAREDFWDDGKPSSKNHHNQKQDHGKGQAQYVAPERKKAFVIDSNVTVKDFSETIGVSVAEIIKKLMSYGVFATINNEIDFDTASMVAEELGVTVTKSVTKSAEEKLDDLFTEDETDEAKMVKRPPIVTVMGHVDHGKTSLLDAIRNTNITDREAGGITQHIGAYTVNHNGNKITFLDTPGHEAFTTMRSRGAKVTDVAVIVVAANDGVMPQTIEAIHHAKAADTPIIIALNKMDLYGANPETIKKQLAENDVLVEDWGGDVACIPVSAKKREGIEDLLEMILLVTEIQELKANPDTRAKGTIIEAKLDKSKGPVATILVQNGTLREGETVVAGMTYGNVRAMFDHNGKRIKKAGPSIPVEITGLNDVPQAGDLIFALEDSKLSRSIVEERISKYREATINQSKAVSLDDLFDQIKDGDMKTLNLIVKADVQGSAEAVKQSLEKLSNEEVKVHCIHSAVGAISEADVSLAKASNAIIIGFNVRAIGHVEDIAQQSGVDIRTYSIIYSAIDDVTAAMKGMLAPVYKEVVQGRAEVRMTFKVSGVGTVAGSFVIKGKIHRHDKVRVIREGIVIHEGEMESLKRFKDDVKEVAESYECGICVKNFNDLQEMDIIEAYAMEEVERK